MYFLRLRVVAFGGKDICQALQSPHGVWEFRADGALLNVQRLSIQRFRFGGTALPIGQRVGKRHHRIRRVRMVRPQHPFLSRQGLSIQLLGLGVASLLLDNIREIMCGCYGLWMVWSEYT